MKINIRITTVFVVCLSIMPCSLIFASEATEEIAYGDGSGSLGHIKTFADAKYQSALPDGVVPPRTERGQFLNASKTAIASKLKQSRSHELGAKRYVSGRIYNQFGSPACAMALASGTYMFTCATNGYYDLYVGSSANGQINLQAFAQGHKPKSLWLDGSFDHNQDIYLQTAGCDAGGPVCGNNICEAGETSDSCLADCPRDPTYSDIKLSITDQCNDGYSINYRFFDTTNNLVWPGTDRHYYTEFYNQRYTSTLTCRTGAKICFGGETGNLKWGVGLNEEQGCTDCCYTCQSGVDQGWLLTCQ